MVCAECGQELAARRTGRPRRYCSRSCQGRAYRRRRDQGRFSAVVHSPPTGAQSQTSLDLAIAIADAEGISALSLGRLAHRAGVALAVVQRDFGSRDRLVALMVQRIYGSFPWRTDAPAEPVQALVRLAELEWRSYRAHPWLVGVLASTRPPLVPAVLESARAAIDLFRGLGLDAGTALNRYLALSAYIQGMGLLLTSEQQEAVHSGTGPDSWWGSELRRLDRSGATRRHPWLVELADQPAAGAFDVDDAFHDGLRQVVAGLVAVP